MAVVYQNGACLTDKTGHSAFFEFSLDGISNRTSVHLPCEQCDQQYLKSDYRG